MLLNVTIHNLVRPFNISELFGCFSRRSTKQDLGFEWKWILKKQLCDGVSDCAMGQDEGFVSCLGKQNISFTKIISTLDR